MPKYRVYGIVTGSKFIGEFEADSPELAKELAAKSDNCYVSICNQCSNEIDDPQITNDLQVEEIE